MEPWIWSLLMLLAGLAVVGLEVFVPSGGVLAVVAALCFGGGIIVAFMDSVATGVTMLGITSLAVPIVIAIAIHWWPHTPIGKRILIPRPEHPDDVLPDTEEYRNLKSLIGRFGKTLSPMLPGGSVTIDRRTYDAISIGMPIDVDAPIEVVEVRMNRLVVRPAAEQVANLESRRSQPDDEILARPFDSLGIEDPLP